MRVCLQCGEENPERFRLCGYCGTPFAAAEAPQEVRKTVTVVFSDLVGSTNLGESLDSESLREVLSRYFQSMQDVLESHGGAVEKFIGDAIVAVFGLPKLREDDALRAVRAAMAMRAALAEVNAELEHGWGVVLTVRTGINTGEVVSGDITAGQRLVTGDTVNVAARLEQTAGAGEILLGELTYRLVRESVEVESVEPLALKGKAEPVPAYRLLTLEEGGGSRRRGEGPLVGREHELGLLLESFEQTRSESSGRMATVLGAAGMGKSRLVDELVKAVEDQASVVRGRCLSHGRGITFWPIVEMVRGAAGILDDDSPQVARAKISVLVDDAGVVERLCSAVGLSTVQFPVEETFWGVRKFLEALSSSRPLVVVFEDIHWAETTLLDLIEHVQDSAETPILIVCLARPEFFDLRPGWDALDCSISMLLGPLSAGDATLIASNLLGEAELDDELEARIVTAADGNPLYVEQMLSMMIDDGLLKPEDGRWVSAAGVAAVTVPPTIQALLAARVDLLGPPERAVIEAASVAGLVFPKDALRELVSTEVKEQLESVLGSLTRKHLVHAEPQTVGSEEHFRFDHVLIRDAAYEGMLKRTRATLHEGFVAWADRVNRDRDRAVEFQEILGYHLEQAYRNLEQLGPLDDHRRMLGARASERLSAAGRRAFDRADMPAAANLLRRAVVLLPEGHAARIELLPDLGEALADIGEFGWAEVFLDEAIASEEAGASGLVGAKAELVLLLVKGHSGSREGWSERMVAAARRAIPQFGQAGDEAGLAMAWRRIAWAHGTACRYGPAAEAAEQAIEHARLAGDLRQGRRAASQYAIAALHGPTPVSEAIRRCDEIVAEASGDHRTEGLVRSLLAVLHGMHGNFDEARRLYAGAQATLEELGGTVVAASTSLASYGIEMLAGDLIAAERELRRDYAALTELGERYLLSTVVGELARVLYAQARYDEADGMSHEAEALADEDDIASQTLWRSVRAKILARGGNTQEGLRLAWEAVELIGRTDAYVMRAETLVDLAEILRLAERESEADSWLDEAVALLDAKENVVAAGGVRALAGSAV